MLMASRLFVCCEAMFNLWKIEPAFLLSFHDGLNQPVLKNQGCSCPALLYPTTSIEMGQQTEFVPILEPFLPNAGGTNCTSSPV